MSFETKGKTLRRLAHVLLGTLALLAPFTAVAQHPVPLAEPSRIETTERELLNSERIERRFGSYGIDVLESDERFRVSNLWSLHDGAKICRTFAVVAYPPSIDPRFRREHEEIVAGGSIGAVFARSGWVVTKRHLHFGELPATRKVAGLMRTDEGVPLAVHVYVLTVTKDEASFDYATIAEVHHPDYLSSADLPPIYGAPADDTDAHDGLVREILAETAARMR